MQRLAITPGEPAGIGPDIVIKAAQKDFGVQLIAVADPTLLSERAEQLGQNLRISTWEQGLPFQQHQPNHLWVLPTSMQESMKIGQLNTKNAAYVIDTLRGAAQGCIDGTFDAMVTGPIQKSVINDAGIAFSGHTEFLQQMANIPKVVMMLASNKLRVALVTTHLPLRKVADAVTEQNVRQSLEILYQDLKQRFGIAQPHILVAGLNPHAGEGGHLGTEERDIIEPVIAQLKQQGMSLEGPLPADTLFTEKYLARADAVLAMYHDQGLPVLKNVSFGDAVNVTLGLPFVRTSVDHGTALSIAGSGEANEQSLVTAINMATDLAQNATK